MEKILLFEFQNRIFFPAISHTMSHQRAHILSSVNLHIYRRAKKNTVIFTEENDAVIRKACSNFYLTLIIYKDLLLPSYAACSRATNISVVFLMYCSTFALSLSLNALIKFVRRCEYVVAGPFQVGVKYWVKWCVGLVGLRKKNVFLVIERTRYLHRWSIIYNNTHIFSCCTY